MCNSTTREGRRDIHTNHPFTPDTSEVDKAVETRRQSLVAAVPSYSSEKSDPELSEDDADDIAEQEVSGWPQLRDGITYLYNVAAGSH